jgi:hypothetical protein
MTITEKQRRTLDLMADSLGWNWSDVEGLSGDLFAESVAGLTKRQAGQLMVALMDVEDEVDAAIAE